MCITPPLSLINHLTCCRLLSVKQMYTGVSNQASKSGRPATIDGGSKTQAGSDGWVFHNCPTRRRGLFRFFLEKVGGRPFRRWNDIYCVEKLRTTNNYSREGEDGVGNSCTTKKIVPGSTWLLRESHSTCMYYFAPINWWEPGKKWAPCLFLFWGNFDLAAVQASLFFHNFSISIV